MTESDDLPRVLPEAVPNPANNGNPCGLDVDGNGPCTDIAIHGGWCRKHGSRYRETGRLQTTRGKGLPKVMCLRTNDDGMLCRNDWFKAGECKEHYTRKLAPPAKPDEPDEPQAPEAPAGMCAQGSCSVVVADSRYCEAHTCLLDGCGERRHSGGYCDRHAAAIKKAGHPDPAGTVHAAPRPMDKIDLHVRPLIEAAQRAGGFTQMMRDGLTRQERDTAAKRASRAVAADKVSMAAADEIANAMGTTPHDMWGIDWIKAEADLLLMEG